MLYLASILSTTLPDLVAQKLLDLSGKKVLCITTASGYKESEPVYVTQDIDSLKKSGALTKRVDVSKQSQKTTLEDFTWCEVVCVTGGNTFYLLQELRKTGSDKSIISAIKEGKDYIGSSAGAAILCPDISYVACFDDPRVHLSFSQPVNLIASKTIS